MYKTYKKWMIRGVGLMLALGMSLFACGCPSPCGIGLPCKASCPFSPKNILEDVVIGSIFD